MRRDARLIPDRLRSVYQSPATIAKKCNTVWVSRRAIKGRPKNNLGAVPILWGLWQSAIVLADLESSCEMAGQLVELAEHVQDPTFYPAAYRTHGESSFWLGEFDPARAYSERGFESYDPDRHRADGFITTGVWAWCRHPNYLGEVGFWWGLFLFALAAGWGNWWTIAGPAAMTILFVFISVPLMDRRMLRRPGYAEYLNRVPALIPRPPR